MSHVHAPVARSRVRGKLMMERVIPNTGMRICTGRGGGTGVGVGVGVGIGVGVEVKVGSGVGVGVGEGVGVMSGTKSGAMSWDTK